MKKVRKACKKLLRKVLKMPEIDEKSGEGAPLKETKPKADDEGQSFDADKSFDNVGQSFDDVGQSFDDVVLNIDAVQKDAVQNDAVQKDVVQEDGVQHEDNPVVYDLSPGSESDVDPYFDGGRFNDRISGMTYGRRIARHLSMTMTTLYNPSLKLQPIVVTHFNEEAGEEEFTIPPPSLDQSWEFFEHHVLPRCFDEDKDNFNLAEPGEKDEKTKLYPILATPVAEMADFGIGVGLYFSMIQYLGVMCFIAGCINLPNMVYYLSDAYSNGQLDVSHALNAGSAVCTDTKWQPCPTCEMEQDNAGGRITKGTSPDDGSEIMFILKNQCDVNQRFGILTLVTVIFVMVSLFLFIYVQRRMRIKFDMQELTTSNYSIVITNPPYNAKDPEIWKQFFEDKFDDLHVTLCTVVLRNQHLIDQMVRRRKLLAKLKRKLPPHVKFDVQDLENIVLQCSEPGFVSRMFFGSVGPKEIYDKVKLLDREIEEIAMSDFPVTRVFVTFEKEEMQQRVMKALTYPKLCKGVVDSMYKFDGHIVLKVREPDEPSAIRWNDLDDTRKSRLIQRFISYAITAGLIALSGVCISDAYGKSALRSTVVILLFNVLTPQVVKIISSFESHVNQTSYDTSVFIKITALRWVNTVIVTAIETPFANWVRDGKYLINALYLLFVGELITRPILQWTDWLGQVKRHLLAPRAKDQRSMNMMFNRGPYSIGEKYTDVTKLLFLTCFYSALIPVAWFFSSVILAIYFWNDKFSLLRTWKHGAKINADISRFSNHFFLTCAVILAMSSTYYFAQFPFDDTCLTGDEVSSAYIGNYTDANGKLMFSITEDDNVYKYCNQLVRSFPPMKALTAEGDEWMNAAQENLLPALGWTAVGVLIATSLMVMHRISQRYLKPFFVKSYTPSHHPDEKPFTEILDDKYAEIEAYVPQISKSGTEFPFLMCDISDIDIDLVGWRGFDDDFADYNLVHDLPQVMRRNRSTRTLGNGSPVFSMVKQWRP